MTSGIYAYWDNEKGYYAYVGRDSNIDKKTRHNEHISKSAYNKQQINKALQNNHDRYEYRVLIEGDYNNWQLNQMEKLCIKSFKTYKYDYPERSVFNFDKGGAGSTGFKASEQTRRKLSELTKGKNHPQWKDYPRIVKAGFHNEKQIYGIKYNGKMIKRSTDRNKLESFLNVNYDVIISGKEIKHMYKITKAGKYNNKQLYAISLNEKRLKTSKDIEKLEEWFKDNYPTEYLIKGV